MENVRNGHIYIQLMKQYMTKNEQITRYWIKTVFPQIYTPNFCISAQESPRR